MRPPRLLEDILGQPESLAGVIDRQFGEGRNALAQAAAAINSRRPVILSGMGSSLYASIPLSYMLAAHGVPALLIESSELLHYQLAAARGAAAVLVSRSGDTVETARLLPLLKEQGTLIIGITNEPDGVLARQADLVMLVGSRGDELVAIQTYTGTLTAMLLLGAAVTNHLDATRRDLEGFLDHYDRELAEHVSAAGEWLPFLESASVVHLLGRGPSLASALEGALLFNEVAKFPAVAMSAGSFRHGSVEVVDASFRGIVFGSQGATQELDRAVARDLIEFGGRVRLIDSRQPKSLIPILEIAPVQAAALSLAENRGEKLGRFRFATHVVMAEDRF